jgi:hypothetical protein
VTDLDTLSLGFRSRFLDFEELTLQLRRWAEAFPEFVSLASIGASEEGRDLWLLTIGRDPTRLRPAAWIDGNIHASELSGSSVCLAIAEDLIRAFAGGPLVDLPAHLTEWLRADVLFYVLPRMCPDGAERVLARRHFVRSNPRDHRLGNQGPIWRHEDVDGDGRSLLMRVVDPTGDFVASQEFPNLMLPRKVEDEGPFYRLFPEGFIERWDGFSIPRPHYLSDTETDMNRNFPTDWRAEPDQIGAGPFPMSEPESRAVVEFAARHPNIFVWLCMHTFGGVYIRPLNDKPDAKMDPHDAVVFRQIERWASELTGYPTVSGFTEFTYEPDKPLHGDLANFAYEDRGAIGFVCELWDFFQQVGFPIKRPFIKNYEEHTNTADILRMAAWDRDHNAGRIVGAWRPHVHPQLGPVEIGGYDPLVGIWNPPLERLHELCSAQSRFFARLAALAPRLTIAEVEMTPLGPGKAQVAVVVENRGYLPTYFLGSARTRPFCDPVRVRVACGPDSSCAPIDTERVVGHLAGWGGNDRSTTPSLARSTGEAARARATFLVEGTGNVEVVASNTRVGEVRRVVTLPAVTVALEAP